MNRRTAIAAMVLCAANASMLPSANAADRPASGSGQPVAGDWPAKPITMIVPFPPGGSTDAVARFVAQHVGERLGRQIVVDNRPGAGGNLGTDMIAKAAPDGYTI